MSSLREYIHEIASDWVTLMSGIASVILTLLTALLNYPLPRYALGMSAIICFVASSFRVWNKEHQAFLSEQRKDIVEEREKREVELQTRRAELVKLERENRQAADTRRIERLDDEVLALVKNDFAELRAQGSLPANLTHTDEWFENAARALGERKDAVRDSVARLRAAGKLNSLRW